MPSIINKVPRLNGHADPLSYMGVNAVTPGNCRTVNRAPTANDSVNFNIGDIWIDDATNTPPTADDIYMLVALIGGQATWIAFGSGDLETLTGNTGGPVVPTANNINVFGSPISIISTTGIGSTLTVDLVNGTNGQLIIGGGADAAWANLTSTGGTIVITNGANSINLETSGGDATTYQADSGSATPAAHILQIVGAHGINTTGATNVITVQINNAITLGDLTPIAANSGAVTATTGDIIITAGDLTLPNTNSAGNQGIIKFGGSRWISNFGTNNTFVGQDAGSLLNTGATTGENVAVGTNALASITQGGTGSEGNVAIGYNALTTYTNSATVDLTGGNVAVGYQALQLCTTGSINTCVGFETGRVITTGDRNVIYGAGSGSLLTTGGKNVLIGDAAGVDPSGGPSGLLTGNGNILIQTLDIPTNYTNAESNNILLNNDGIVGENNTMRLGSTGAGNGQVNRTFIAAIRGTTTGVADAINVLIDSAGQLGTVSSSRVYKDNIRDMNQDSSSIMKLRPVTFNYKKHPKDHTSYGLIAEEVEEVMPKLVYYDKDNKPETVYYHHLPVLLLNELQRLEKRVQELEARLK